MIIICAWCKGEMGEKNPIQDERITHGICKPCADELRKKYKMSEALDSTDINTMINLIDKR
jgi:hypothetical protein